MMTGTELSKEERAGLALRIEAALRACSGVRGVYRSGSLVSNLLRAGASAWGNERGAEPIVSVAAGAEGVAVEAAIGVEFGEAPVLAEGGLGRHAAGRRALEGAHRFALRLRDVPARQRIRHGRAMDCWQRGIDQPGAIELAEDRHDAAVAVDVFHMHVRDGRRDLTQHRHAP